MLDNPPNMIDLTNYFVLRIPLVQIIPCGQMDNYGPNGDGDIPPLHYGEVRKNS